MQGRHIFSDEQLHWRKNSSAPRIEQGNLGKTAGRPGSARAESKALFKRLLEKGRPDRDAFCSLKKTLFVENRVRSRVGKMYLGPGRVSGKKCFLGEGALRLGGLLRWQSVVLSSLLSAGGPCQISQYRFSAFPPWQGWCWRGAGRFPRRHLAVVKGGSYF